MTTRADLRWALDACLPHVGKLPLTAVVGLTGDGQTLDVYATDRYTVAVANVDHFEKGLEKEWTAHLPASEARDLLRFVRPEKKKHETDEVVLLPVDLGYLGHGAATYNELHVGLVDDDGETYDSAVFETTSSPVTSRNLRALIANLDAKPPDVTDTLTYWPRLFGRFAKAERHEADRLELAPKQLVNSYGAAVVAVGDRFVGAICGMTYEKQESGEAA